MAVLAALAALLGAGAARAERTISVNEPGTGIFDQPSAVLSGQAAHVTFVGRPSGDSGYKVYYAAVNAGADFGNVNLLRDNTVLPVMPVVVDNETSAYADARHPRIAVREASGSRTRLTILFQAKRFSPADNAYRPFLADLVVVNNVVTSMSVGEIAGIPEGDVEEISFALVAADNTVRLVYAWKPAVDSAQPFDLYFARVALDNGAVAGTPVPVTPAWPAARGVRPVPDLKLDDLNRSHVAWAAAPAADAQEAPICYAMIKETN